MAAARDGLSSVAIAKREKLSDRQVRRILAAAAPAAGVVAELEVPDVFEIDPFLEVARSVLIHREAVNALRGIAQTTTNAAVKIGAVKGAVAASTALIELLARTWTVAGVGVSVAE